MKYAAILLAIFTSYAVAETTYTLTESNGVYTFTPVVEEPVEETVTEEPAEEPAEEVAEITDPELREVAYCQRFDTSQGLTFDYLEWSDRCDTNEDGVYQFCEDWQYSGPISFNYIWWTRGCDLNEDFTPVQD